jgi:two-component system CheB/CheR fusion protein
VERQVESWREPPRDPSADLQREAERALLSRFVPAGVLVNSTFEVLQFRGDTGQVLAPAPGKASLNLLKMAREGLLISLRAVLQKARKDDSPAYEHGVRVRTNGGYSEVSVSVIPVGRGNTGERCFWVLFEVGKHGKHAAHAQAPVSRGKEVQDGESDPQVSRLTSELAATREYLQSVIEQQEAANEELQSANEEVQSANEELQSINEELETSKEEIQSSNEELTTVNEELHIRNEELNRANNDLNNLFSSVQMAIVMVWQDLRIRRFTPMAEKLFNLIPTDIGRPVGDIKLNLEVQDLPQLLTEVIDSVSIRELDVQDRHGHRYLLRIRPYKTFDNKIDGAVIVLVDIDSLRQSQEPLERRVRELADADRHKNEFLAMLAHELRNPLEPLRNAVQIITSTKAEADAITRARDLMATQVGTLTRLVDDLLDAARINRGQVQLRKAVLQLQAIMDRAVESTREQIDGRSHRLTVRMPPEPVYVEADSTRLEQVFGNLLANAAKYSSNGGEITVSASIEQSRASATALEVVVRIRDTGIGIAPDMLPRVFELFTQADQSLARVDGGLGIGLSVVRRLVELHGGRVEAQSQGLGHGSEFIVYLPAMPERPAEPASDERRKHKGAASKLLRAPARGLDRKGETCTSKIVRHRAT